MQLNDGCTKCGLCKDRRKIVWGEGPENAALMFIAEAPGEWEDRKGHPFWHEASAGMEFEKLLVTNGIRRENCFITNIVKCHPFKNRDPKEEEIEACSEYLNQELLRCEPKIVVTVGRFSTQRFLPGADMEQVHGIPHRVYYPAVDKEFLVVPVFHPAAGLRSSEMMMRCQWDFKTVVAILRGELPTMHRQDQFKERETYNLVKPGKEHIQYLLQEAQVLAVDTETVDGKAWSVQFCTRAGSGYVIRADNEEALEYFRWFVASEGTNLDPPLIVVHNAMFDLPILWQLGIYPKRIADTMVMAYLLQSEPQGLKPLAYRHAGMEMMSFSDMVGTYGTPKMLEYLVNALNYEWPNPAPQLEFRKDGRPHIKQPQNIAKKIQRILKDYDDPLKEVNIWERWHNIAKELGREQVEARLGEMPQGSIQDVWEKDPSRAIWYACVAGETLIETEEGPQKVREIVKNQYTGRVWAFENGQRVLRHVTGWYKIRKKERIDWLSISTKYDRYGISKTRFTPDHKVLTRRGMVAIEELKVGTDEIALPVQSFTQEQRQVILGSLLGDGCVKQRNQGGWGILAIGHCTEQRLYLEWKYSLLGSFTTDGGITQVHKNFYSFSTIAHPWLLDLREQSYNADRDMKGLGSWLGELGPLGLAIWYQDDGTLVNGRYPRLCTNRYTEKEVELLRAFLFKRFGLITSKQVCRPGQWFIQIAAKSAACFFDVIAKFVHPCMQYKMPKKWHNKLELITFTPAKPFYAKVLSVDKNPISAGRKESLKTCYCIDVESAHNFFTQDAIAKNCRDADATFRIYPYLWSRIQAFGLQEAFEIDMGCIPMAADMQEAGIKPDLEKFKELSAAFERKILNLESEISKIAKYPVNPNSHVQVKELLFDKLKLKCPKRKLGTDDKILARMVPQHRVIQMIRDYRTYTKLKGTYTDELPKKAAESSDGRIHTTLRVTRTSTGRLSSANPNLQNQPVRTSESKEIRNAFMSEDGTLFCSADYCLVAGTKIITTEGTKNVEDIRVGDGVLSSRDGKSLEIQNVEKAAWIGRLPVVEIELEDGSTVQCTEDHKWMRFDGSFSEARDLKPGDKMAHVKEGFNGQNEYETWWIRSNRNYLVKHRAIAAYHYGSCPAGCEVDHVDGDKHNNTLQNLRYLGASENHAQGWKRFWGGLRKDREAYNKRMQQQSKWIRENRRSYSGEGNPRFGYRKGGTTICPVCKTEFYAPPCKKQIYCSQKCYHISRKTTNHKIKSIRYIGIRDVWHLTVHDTHTFVLENGLISSNSGIEMRVAAHVSQDPFMLKIFREGKDLHAETASAIFGIPVDQLDKMKHRYPAKRVGFGILYGITAAGLREHLIIAGLDEKEWTFLRTQQLISEWFNVYKGVRDYMERTGLEARRTGFVRDMWGRIRFIPYVRAAEPRLQAEGIRQAGNQPIQAGAQGIIKKSMAALTPIYKQFQREGYYIKPIIQIHDDLLFEVQRELVPIWVPIQAGIMSNIVDLDVPTPVDPGVGPRWGMLEPYSLWTG